MSEKSRAIARQWRHQRVRAAVAGTAARPRLNVYRSLQHIYAQVIDDVSGRTLAAASTVDAEAFLYALLILGDLTLAMSLPVREAKERPRGPARANPSEPRASPKAPPKMTRPVSPTEFGDGNG